MSWNGTFCRMAKDAYDSEENSDEDPGRNFV